MSARSYAGFAGFMLLATVLSVAIAFTHREFMNETDEPQTRIEIVYEDASCRIMRVADSDGTVHHWSTCGEVMMKDCPSGT